MAEERVPGSWWGFAPEGDRTFMVWRYIGKHPDGHDLWEDEDGVSQAEGTDPPTYEIYGDVKFGDTLEIPTGPFKYLGVEYRHLDPPEFRVVEPSDDGWLGTPPTHPNLTIYGENSVSCVRAADRQPKRWILEKVPAPEPVMQVHEMPCVPTASGYRHLSSPVFRVPLKGSDGKLEPFWSEKTGVLPGSVLPGSVLTDQYNTFPGGEARWIVEPIPKPEPKFLPVPARFAKSYRHLNPPVFRKPAIGEPWLTNSGENVFGILSVCCDPSVSVDDGHRWILEAIPEPEPETVVVFDVVCRSRNTGEVVWVQQRSQLPTRTRSYKYHKVVGSERTLPLEEN